MINAIKYIGLLLKNNLKDLEVILIYITLPIVLIIILGLSLSSLYEFDDQEKVVITQSVYTDLNETTEIYTLNYSETDDEDSDAYFYSEDGSIKVSYKTTDEVKKSKINVVLNNLILANETSKEIYPTMYEYTEFPPNEEVVDNITNIDSTTYFIVSMTILSSVYMVLYSSQFMYKIFKSNYSQRIGLSKFSQKKIFIFTFLVLLLQSIIQTAIILIISSLFAPVNLLYIFIPICILNILCILIGMFICSYSRLSQKNLKITLHIAIPICLFLAGTYYKLDLGTFKYLSPVYYMNNYVYNCLFKSAINIEYTIIFTVLSLIIFFVVISRVKEVNHEK